MIDSIFRLLARILGKDVDEVVREVHAFEYGWGEGVTRFKEDEVPDYIAREPHYFKVGHGIGALTWPVVIGIIILILRLVW